MSFSFTAAKLELFEWIVCFVWISLVRTRCQIDSRQQHILCGTCDAHPHAFTLLCISFKHEHPSNDCGAIRVACSIICTYIFLVCAVQTANIIKSSIRDSRIHVENVVKLSNTHNIHFVIYVQYVRFSIHHHVWRMRIALHRSRLENCLQRTLICIMYYRWYLVLAFTEIQLAIFSNNVPMETTLLPASIPL